MARTKNPGKDKGKGKGKESASFSQPRPQVCLFDSESRQDRYFTSFESREVLEGRYLDLDFLNSIDFSHIGIFKEFGWWNFMKIHRSIYKDVIRALYSNASKTLGKGNLMKGLRLTFGTSTLRLM